jgi:hypothetical protein
MTGRDADVEVWVDRTDSSIDLLVEFVFGPRLRRAAKLACRFIQMLVIQIKIHRTKDDVETLQNVVVVRNDLYDVLVSDPQSL